MATDTAQVQQVDQIIKSLKESGSCVLRPTYHYFSWVQLKVSKGGGAKMFTLWVETATDDGYWHEDYAGILSNNFDKAIQKVANIAFNHPGNIPGNRFEVVVKATYVNEKKQADNSSVDVFPFGKYKGYRFSEVEDNGYKEWLLPILEDKGSGYKRLYNNLYQNVIDNGFVRQGDKLVSPETLKKQEQRSKQQEDRQKFWDNLRENSRYLDVPVGSKIGFFRAYKLFETSFDTNYGLMFIQTFMDEEERVFVYKGSEPVIEVDNGQAFYIRGKVKEFTDYNGICQTRISNPVVLDSGKLGLCGETWAKIAKNNGYESMQQALQNPDFVEEVVNWAVDLKNIAKKDIKFAKSVIGEVFSDIELK